MFGDIMQDVFGKPDAAPMLEKLKLPKATEGIAEWGTQLKGDSLKTLTSGVDTLNQDVQSRINKTYANFGSDWTQAQDTTSSLMKGEIPSDVAGMISRSAAARSMGGGFGFNSGMGRNLEARDLGLTSLDLMNQGFNRMGSQLGTAQALNPFNISSFMFSPQQLLQRQDQQALTNLGITHQNQALQYQNDQRRSWISNLLTDTIKSGIETPFKLFQNANTLTQQAPQMMGGMAMNMCGGGGAPVNNAPASSFTPSTSWGIQPTQNATWDFQSAFIPPAPRY